MTDPGLEREALALFEAMLDVPEAERDRWLAGRTAGRAALAGRVEAMRAADRKAALQTGAAVDAVDEEEPPERIGAYRIVDRIGRGGMGSVYRGERVTGDFAHVAAIKIIKPGLLSEALVERFQRERQLLAQLSHPNIAHLYDGGETESGSPYIVMEYVDGLPVLQWIAGRETGLEERRRLFADICAAVAFAHRSLIVHRDLTPSNVLVTRGGTVKLIDFGIAKMVDAGAAEEGGQASSLGGLSFTPGYAAPERMTSAEVTTGADVYSLGKLLEQIVPPGPKDVELKAIVARATEPDPGARYASADALGEDVEALFRGYPVAAAKQGRWYVARKFVGRNLPALAAAATVLLLLVGALAITLLANARADRSRAEAEARFEQTRGIAKTLLFEAYDAVSRVPGSTPARALLAHTGLSYLDALAASPGAPLDVLVEAARGYIRLAQVTGSGQGGQLGRFADSNTLLGKAEAILRPLAIDHPDDPGVRQARASLLAEQSGTNLYNNNDTATARRQAQEAQALLRSNPVADVETARLYALATQAEGDTFLWSDEFAQARAIHLRAEAFIVGLPPAMQRDPRIMAVRSGNLRLLGEAYHKLHQEDLTRAVLDQAVAINRALVRGHPDDPALWRKLVISLRYRAVVHRTNHRAQLANESIEEAAAGARMLWERDRSDAGAMHLFTLVSEVQAEILADLGRFPESYAIGEQARVAYGRMVELAGDAPGARRSMAQALRTDAENHYNGRDYAGACRLWRESWTMLTALDRRGELSGTDRNILTELRDYIHRACEDGPPRGSLGATL